MLLQQRRGRNWHVLPHQVVRSGGYQLGSSTTHPHADTAADVRPDGRAVALLPPRPPSWIVLFIPKLVFAIGNGAPGVGRHCAWAGRGCRATPADMLTLADTDTLTAPRCPEAPCTSGPVWGSLLCDRQRAPRAPRHPLPAGGTHVCGAVGGKAIPQGCQFAGKNIRVAAVLCADGWMTTRPTRGARSVAEPIPTAFVL